MWGYAFDPSQLDAYQKLTPEERNPGSTQEALAQMKDYIQKRGAWMDSHIDALAQYAHPSQTKKYENEVEDETVF